MQGADVSLRSLIDPHERQVDFLKATDRYAFTLYGGARGGGKSYILLWSLVRYLLLLTGRGFSEVQVAIFCNTFKEVRRRQWIPARRMLPKWLGRFYKGDYEFVFAPAYGSHTIQFVNLDDPEKYKGAEYAAVAVDELTLCPDRSILNIFRGCLRWKGLTRFPFIAATNPDGPGHSWVKRLWVTKDFTNPDDSALSPDQFQFIRALPTDNPHLPKEYIEENLAGLPESLRKPWLEGSWDLFEGQRFQLNKNVHACDPVELSSFEPCKFYRSIDYGFDNPYACGWYVVFTDERGNMAVRKIAEDVRSGLKCAEQIKRVHEITKSLGLEHRIETTYLDTACWKEEDEGLSIADKFIAGNIPVTQVLKDRATGWTALELMLYWTEGEQPVLKFFKTCPFTMQQITDAMWDPKKPGDIAHPEGFRDDALDETRYFVLTHFQPPKQNSEKTHDEDMRERWRIMTKGK